MEYSAHELFLKKVMVIDDNPSDRYIADFLIGHEKFASETIQQESAPKALHYLKGLEESPEEMPEMIFLDIKMPEMDGFEFLNEFKLFPETLRTRCRIIMLSSSMDPEDKLRASKEPEVFGFISKPIDKEKLEALRSEFSSLKIGAPAL